jgi:hypothetical protein
MGKNKLTTLSQVERQNILNNPYAIKEIENATQFKGIPFEDKIVYTKDQICTFFEISTRTIETYLSKYEDELKSNGYELLRGKRLLTLKESMLKHFGTEVDFGTKTTVLGVFDFRAFLNIAMLLQDSEKARILRGLILDIVIDTVNKKTGGGTKYINQRDEDFIISYYKGENYRKEFSNALNEYVDMGKVKYAIYTNKVYQSIFKENADEYRKILKLQTSEKIRDTFYSEILDLVSSYEYGFSIKLKEAFKDKGRKLDQYETDMLFKQFEQEPHWIPLVEKARNKMSSRDLAFRDAFHDKLANYITPVNKEDFERFIGEKSKELSERLKEAKEVLKRLKDRE